MPQKKLPTPLDIQALKDDPVAFTAAVLKRIDGQPAIPHPAQEQLLRSVRRLTVAVCGRQFGKSEGFGYLGTWYSATKANKRIYVIAPTLDQARIIFNEIARHYRTSLRSLVRGKVVDYPFPKIILKNGTEIHARGANSPQYIRGKNAHLIICDEAAFFKDKTITDVIQPMQTVTGKDPDAALILVGTPFGESAFKQLFEEAHQSGEVGDSGYTALGDPYSYGVSALAAWCNYPSSANPHADRAFLERVKRRYGEDSLLWRTEYLAEFADSDLQVFPWAQLRWAYENYPGFEEGSSPDFPKPPLAGHSYAHGADLANRSDYYVSAILDATNTDRIIFSAMTRYRNRGWASIKRSIAEVYQRFYQAPTLVDATSLGESVVEDLVAQGIPAQGYKFTGNAAKHEVVQELARLFAERRLVIPYDPDIINELRYFEYDITPSGVVRMEARRGHDDIVMALALAAHLVLLPRQIGLFTPVEALDYPLSTYAQAADTSWQASGNPFTTSRRPAATLDRTPEGYRDPFADLNSPDPPPLPHPRRS